MWDMKTEVKHCIGKLELFEEENRKTKKVVKKLKKEKVEMELYIAISYMIT